MKDDVGPLPERVPRNRRQVQALADLHIAMWLASDSLTPGERKKLQAERERRHNLAPEVVVGIVCGDEGATPQQLRTLREILPRIGPTKIVQIPLPGKVNHVAKSIDVPRDVMAMREVVHQSTVLVAIQKETTIQEHKVGDWSRGVPSAIGYAKHRSTPVRIILPNGTEVRQ